MTTLEQMMQKHEESQMAEFRTIAARVLAALIHKEPYETPEQMKSIAEKAWRIAAMFFYIETKVTGLSSEEDGKTTLG